MGWIGVDLDGTLAHYERGAKFHGSIGAPVPRMVERVKSWIADGKEVRIVTARVWAGHGSAAVEEQYLTIQDWLLAHIGERLPIVDNKDPQMIELWDDRAVSVHVNTGYAVKAGNGVAHAL